MGIMVETNGKSMEILLLKLTSHYRMQVSQLRWNQCKNPMEWGYNGHPPILKWNEYKIGVVNVELKWKTIRLKSNWWY